MIATSMYMYMYIHLSGNWRQAGNEMVVREKACIMHNLKQSSLRVNIITVNAYAFYVLHMNEYRLWSRRHFVDSVMELYQSSSCQRMIAATLVLMERGWFTVLVLL